MKWQNLALRVPAGRRLARAREAAGARKGTTVRAITETSLGLSDATRRGSLLAPFERGGQVVDLPLAAPRRLPGGASPPRIT